jgi:hypothetical protein
MAKSKVMDRPMFKGAEMSDEPVMDVENVGIMSGFKDLFEDDDEEMDEDDMEMSQIMGRTPDSPEILMNNLRGDMRSLDARRDELADLVGYEAAEETPESVLAMLQPVLASQGGIGGLPQPGAMPPGPPPGMMPPTPPGGMPPDMGMPQPPVPPVPPVPPPEMAGGIGGLPAGGMPPPVQMAKGGIVQRFSRGTTGPTEDQDGGVSPSTDMSSVLAGLSPDIRAQAQKAFLASLQTPAALPDRATLAKTLADEYRTLLGSDKKSAQAQLLLELGQRAFGYAANVDAEGRPLRGSPLARLAGAVRTLPATVGKYTAEMDKEDRALKLMGLQAAEKRYETAQEARLKQQKTLADLYAEDVKLAAKNKGQGVKGTPFNQYQELIPSFIEGTLDQPGQIRLLNTVAEMVKPETVSYTNRFGYQVTEVKRGDVPRTFYDGLVRNFGQEAADSWVSSLGEGVKISPIAYPTAVGPGTVPTKGSQRTTATTPTVRDTTEGALRTPEGARLLENYSASLNPDPNNPGLWQVRGYLAGPINTAEAFLTRNLPFMDPNKVDKTRKDATKTNEALIEALATNDGKLSNDEMSRLRPLIGLTPRVFGSEGAMTTALVSLDDALLKERANHMATINAKDVLASAASNARLKVNLIDNYRMNLKVPPSIFTNKDFASLPVGQEFVDKRDPNQFDIRRKDTFSFRNEEAIRNFQAQNPGKPYAVMLPSGKIQLYTAPGKAK